ERIAVLETPLPALLLRARVGEIRARAEVLAGAREHQRAHVGLLVELFEDVGETFDQRGVEEVVRRTVDLDEGDVTSVFHDQLFHASLRRGGGQVIRSRASSRRSTAPSTSVSLSTPNRPMRHVLKPAGSSHISGTPAATWMPASAKRLPFFSVSSSA